MKDTDFSSTHLDHQLSLLREDVLKMWRLVIAQLEDSKAALTTVNKDIAVEVIFRENSVNALELLIDDRCEDIIALFTPVASDLRFVLASLKINANLERIGDIAEGVAKFVANMQPDFDSRLLEVSHIPEMFNQSVIITTLVMEAFEKKDTGLARRVFGKDKILDEINNQAAGIIATYLKDEHDSSKIMDALYILSAIRKLERVGDQAKNIAEELIFYAEAEVLKHRSKDRKK